MSEPDTTEAVTKALEQKWFGGHVEKSSVLAAVAIAADRQALTEQGYEIVKRGDVPDWMQECGRIDAHAGGEIHSRTPDCDEPDNTTPPCGHVYSLKTESEA